MPTDFADIVNEMACRRLGGFLSAIAVFDERHGEWEGFDLIDRTAVVVRDEQRRPRRGSAGI